MSFAKGSAAHGREPFAAEEGFAAQGEVGVVGSEVASPPGPQLAEEGAHATPRGCAIMRFVFVGVGRVGGYDINAFAEVAEQG